jgi:hypothetical protein
MSKPLRSRTIGLYLEEDSGLHECRNHRGETQLVAKNPTGRRDIVLLCPLPTRLTHRTDSRQVVRQAMNNSG